MKKDDLDKIVEQTHRVYSTSGLSAEEAFEEAVRFSATAGYEVGLAEGALFGGDMGGEDSLIIEVPRQTVVIYDPQVESVIARAEAALSTLDRFSIVGDGMSGGLDSGFASVNDAEVPQ
jgi:hypothetical protein